MRKFVNIDLEGDKLITKDFGLRKGIPQRWLNLTSPQPHNELCTLPLHFQIVYCGYISSSGVQDCRHGQGGYRTRLADEHLEHQYPSRSPG
jgi:hypothetical protein